MAVMPVVARRPKRELGHVQRAEVERTGSIQAGERGRCRRCHPVASDLRAAGRDPPLAVIHVLVRQRHAVERPLPAAALGLGIGQVGGRLSMRGVELDEGVKLVIPAVDALEAGLDRGACGRLAGPDPPRELAR